MPLEDWNSALRSLPADFLRPETTRAVGNFVYRRMWSNVEFGVAEVAGYHLRTCGGLITHMFVAVHRSYLLLPVSECGAGCDNRLLQNT